VVEQALDLKRVPHLRRALLYPIVRPAAFPYPSVTAAS
jgi:hypothetical protein